MPVRSSAVGTTITSEVVDVTTRRLLAYAAGLRDTNPRYMDDAAVGGIVAHPAFCTALEWPVALRMRQQDLGLYDEERLRGVHAGQDSTFHRLLKVGDEVCTTGTLIQVKTIKPGAFLVTKFVTKEANTGEVLATSYSSSIFRGVTVQGEDRILEEIPPLPAVETPAGALTQDVIPIAPEAPHVYTECAQIWNPIHTERQVALAAGLPDIILHGTATWALAARSVIQGCAAGEPTRLHRLAGRFAAMVLPGTSITVQYTARQTAAVPYTVCNAQGMPAITQGMACFTSQGKEKSNREV